MKVKQSGGYTVPTDKAKELITEAFKAKGVYGGEAIKQSIGNKRKAGGRTTIHPNRYTRHRITSVYIFLRIANQIGLILHLVFLM